MPMYKVIQFYEDDDLEQVLTVLGFHDQTATLATGVNGVVILLDKEQIESLITFLQDTIREQE